MKGKLARRRTEEGRLLSWEITPGGAIEIFDFDSALDAWVWTPGVVEVGPAPDGLFRVKSGQASIPCWVADEWDGEAKTLMEVFNGPCSWRWPR